MLTENSLYRKQYLPDSLYVKRLFRVTSPDEVSKVLQTLDKIKLEKEDRIFLKRFFSKIRLQFDSWYETILGFTENFDVNTEVLYRSTNVTHELKVEKKLCEPKKFIVCPVSERLMRKRASARKWYRKHREEILSQRREKYGDKPQKGFKKRIR